MALFEGYQIITRMFDCWRVKLGWEGKYSTSQRGRRSMMSDMATPNHSFSLKSDCSPKEVLWPFVIEQRCHSSRWRLIEKPCMSTWRKLFLLNRPLVEAGHQSIVVQGIDGVELSWSEVAIPSARVCNAGQCYGVRWGGRDSDGEDTWAWPLLSSTTSDPRNRAS